MTDNAMICKRIGKPRNPEVTKKYPKKKSKNPRKIKTIKRKIKLKREQKLHRFRVRETFVHDYMLRIILNLRNSRALQFFLIIGEIIFKSALLIMPINQLSFLADQKFKITLKKDLL